MIFNDDHGYQWQARRWRELYLGAGGREPTTSARSQAIAETDSPYHMFVATYCTVIRGRIT